MKETFNGVNIGNLCSFVFMLVNLCSFCVWDEYYEFIDFSCEIELEL